MKMRETSRDTDKKPCVNNYLTWANQVRLLQLNIQSLAGTIGQGLIAAVLPAVKALNTLFAVLQKVANAVRDFFYVLTGYKPESSGGGIADTANDFGDAADNVSLMGGAGEDAAKGMDKASKSAKKLKNNMNTLGIDELNIISPDTKSDTGGSGGSGGGGAGGGGLDTGGLTGESIFDALGKSDPETPVNEWATRLRNAFLDHDWDKLGEEIAWGINTGLQKVYDEISWENVGPKITPAINAFTQTFNSMVDNINWTLMGQTLGAGVNTLVNSLNLLIEGIDWTNLGVKISEGIRGAISEIQWTNLGNLLGNYFMISWDTLNGFVTGMAQTNMAGLTGFEQVGTAIGSAINGIFQKVDFGTIGTTLATGFNGIFDAIRALSITVDWSGIATNISTGLDNMIHGINWAENGQSLSRFVLNMLDTIKDVASQVDWAAFGKGVGDFLGAIDWVTILSDVATIIYDSASGMISGLFDSDSGTVIKLITTFFVGSKLAGIGLKFGNAISEAMTENNIKTNILKTVGTFFKDKVFTKIFSGISISTIASSVGTWITGTFAPAIASAFSAVAGVLFSPIGIAVVGAIIGGFLIFKNWDKITEFAGNVKDKIVSAFSDAGEWLKEKGSALIDGLKNGVEAGKELFGAVVSDLGTFVTGKIGDATQWLTQKGSDIVTGIKNGYEAVKNSEFLDKVGKLKDEAFDKIGDIKEKVTTKGKNIIDGLKEGYQSIKESEFLSKVATIKDETFKKIGTIKEKITQKGKDVINGLKDGYTSIKETGFLNTVSKIKDEVFTKIGDIKDKVLQKGKDIIQGLRDGFDEKWEDFKTFLSGIPEKITKAIGSLKDTGKKIMQGLVDGFKNITIPKLKVTTGTKTVNILGKDIKIPDIDITWAAKGGLFDGPSIIGVGEAGREAVLPLENPRTMRMIAKSILNNMPSGGLGMTAQNLSKAVESGVLSGMSRALTNASIINHTDVYQRKDVLSDRVYVGSPIFTDDSVNVSGGRTLEQDARTDYILQQILETSQKILAKDTSVKLDGKRTDTLLSRAKHNSGYSFVTT